MAESKFNTIKIEKSGDGITWLILNRPEKRNAMSPELHHEMDRALDDLADDKDTRVLVLTGAGKAFSAGQDIRLYFRGNEGDPRNRRRSNHASHSWRWQRLSEFPKPTIAMVNGFCFGGAFTQVSACDFAIAADDATFGLSEVNWGIIPGGIVSWNVVQMMNLRDAIYYSVTGDPFNGKAAAKIGFVNFSVPKARLRAETVKLAKKLLKKSPNAMRYTKEAIRAVKQMSVDQARDYLAAKNVACKATDAVDGRGEGMRQFLDEKTYRPGLGEFDMKKATARKAKAGGAKAAAATARRPKTARRKAAPGPKAKRG